MLPPPRGEPCAVGPGLPSLPRGGPSCSVPVTTRHAQHLPTSASQRQETDKTAATVALSCFRQMSIFASLPSSSYLCSLKTGKGRDPGVLKLHTNKPASCGFTFSRLSRLSSLLIKEWLSWWRLETEGGAIHLAASFFCGCFKGVQIPSPGNSVQEGQWQQKGRPWLCAGGERQPPRRAGRLISHSGTTADHQPRHFKSPWRGSPALLGVPARRTSQYISWFSPALLKSKCGLG